MERITKFLGAAYVIQFVLSHLYEDVLDSPHAEYQVSALIHQKTNKSHEQHENILTCLSALPSLQEAKGGGFFFLK